MKQRVSDVLVQAAINSKMEMTNAHRVQSGPDVKGTRPLLVSFQSVKDRDEILRKVGL